MKTKCRVLTPAILVENINKGCELIEKTFDRLGQECSWEEFNKAMGRSAPGGRDRLSSDHGFEKVRSAYFDGEGLGRRFLAEFLPGAGKTIKQF